MPACSRFLATALLLSLAGCDDSGRPPGTNPSSPSPLSNTVSGVVTFMVDGVSRPIADRSVWIWVDPQARGQSAVTDQNGRYSAQVPRNARVFVTAYASSFEQQPCIASAVVERDKTVNVQVVPLGSPADPPAALASPLITGLVYQATAEGRRPVRANIQFRLSQENVIAFTQTDSRGRFFFCRVNTAGHLDVAALEISSSSSSLSYPVTGTSDVDLEFDLTARSMAQQAGLRCSPSHLNSRISNNVPTTTPAIRDARSTGPSKCRNSLSRTTPMPKNEERQHQRSEKIQNGSLR